ncbi:tannase/feruloyl esterase family alpha/beta hydrolase [Alteromonas sp. CI.11.F.A3]|uniref:tannase/feruloyl esterase family alpha/beta hydrolase n=1 Tax=Alteromonas sp. CI.11.F.A3 TaxID=3079555 RepID=UPI002942EFA5|nr:tannase/feruloyl esterase family alpha/beta hydrolase [Alteromonas sp. CI.11.F.A3]WOI36386.1 tannase/feruloyl esterase family alpha/beta hydrolase [Alteromonas sp. CI.11.F.A3]
MILRTIKVVAIGALISGLAACNSSDDDPLPVPPPVAEPEPLPQLSAAVGAAFSGNCNDLTANLSELENTEITSSSEVAAGELTVAGNDIAAHCLVTGNMHQRVSSVDGNAYAIGFEMRLPIDWNGRFYHQANGGIDGRASTAIGGGGPGGLTNALYQGFAVLSSDAGHSGSLGPTFGVDPIARLDYGYTAVEKLTPMAKQLISLAYGKGPDRSYFGGCSNGGRHTFNTFARMPNEYDGYLAGAPGFRLPYAAIANIFGAQQYHSVATDPDDLSTGFTEDERGMVAAAALVKCDDLDGVNDGQIHAFEACQEIFSLDDVPTCIGDRDGSCLSAAQKTAIAPIFSGAVTSTGEEFYAPFPFDTGIATGGYAQWEFDIPTTRDTGAVAFIWGVPVADPATFDDTDFGLNGSIDDMITSVESTDDIYTEAANSFMIPPNNGEELSAVRERGAKIMVYHGMSDPIFSPLDTVNWYKNLSANNNDDATDFARLYMIPGMGHCSGGPAVDQVDLLTPLVAWVENGTAPDNLVATARGAGNVGGENGDVPADWSVDRSRPLCQYPLVAHYDSNSSGDVELAASFSCQ